MKLTGAVLLGLLLPAAASGADLRLGVLGATNFARVGYQPSPQGLPLDTLTRWGAGGVVEVGFSESLSLVAQPMYLGKGMRFTDGESELRYELDYVEVPVLLKYRFAGGGVRPFIQGGPSLGFNRKSQLTFENGTRSQTTVSDEGYINSTDFSLWLGAGLDVPAGGARTFIEAGYAFGLTDVTGGDDDVTTHGFQVKVGVTFGL